MFHTMKLHNQPFEMIKSGRKNIELRLYDKKRKNIKVDDLIEFTNIDTNEKIRVKVLKLHQYNSFDELYRHVDKCSLGYQDDEIASPSDMELYYSKEEQSQYGVVGIEITLLN